MLPFLAHYVTLLFAVGMDIQKPFPKSIDPDAQSLPATYVGSGDEAELPGGGCVRPEPALHGLIAQIRVQHVAPLQGQVIGGLGLIAVQHDELGAVELLLGLHGLLDDLLEDCGLGVGARHLTSLSNRLGLGPGLRLGLSLSLLLLLGDDHGPHPLRVGLLLSSRHLGTSVAIAPERSELILAEAKTL